MRFKQDLTANHAPSGRIVIVTLIAAFISGCVLLGPNEKYREERGRTFYRSADHAGSEDPPALPERKVPGQ